MPSATAQPVIVVRGLVKDYGTTRALHGIDFTVQRGEVVALVGPNGAGKTTTLEILEGYREPTAGEAQVLGMAPSTGGRALRRRIGIVLQECGIEPYLRVREILVQRARYYPQGADPDALLDLVGLAGKARATVKTLSGGQKRRLDLALALVGNPELVFLDEPTTGFDPSARRASWQLVRSLCAGGKTVLLTTHYMEEAQHLANRVVLIAQGRIAAQGSPDELIRHIPGDASIRFMLPDGCRAEELPCRADVDGGWAEIRCTGTTEILHTLTSWALARGVELEGLRVGRPSLEDVYIHLTEALAHDGEGGDAAVGPGVDDDDATKGGAEGGAEPPGRRRAGRRGRTGGKDRAPGS